MTFATLLSRWLESRDLSPERAAPLLGVGHVAIYAWLNNQYQPSNTRVPLLARAMNVSEESLRTAIAASKRAKQKAKP